MPVSQPSASSSRPSAAAVATSAVEVARRAPCPGTATAYARLEDLHAQSRVAARVRYDDGPGRKRPKLDHLPETDVRVKKNKKTTSAYISRFQQQEYDIVLPAAVADAEGERNRLAEKAEAAVQEHNFLLKRIAELNASIGNRQGREEDNTNVDIDVDIDFDVDDAATEFSASTLPAEQSSPPTPQISPPFSMKQVGDATFSLSRAVYPQTLVFPAIAGAATGELFSDAVATADKLIEMVLAGNVKALSADAIAQVFDPSWTEILPMPLGY
jgi:hypothetical protein